MDDNTGKWKETTWRIQPMLNMPELDPEAVQIAMFESDPVEEYQRALAQNRERLSRELGQEGDSKRREILRKVHMTETWDRLFKTTTGDQVHLLVSSRSDKRPLLSRMIVISSNSPGGHTWLATKTTHHDRMPLCWCIPVDTVIGRSVQVELRKGNVLDIQKLYEEVMG